MFEEEPMNLIMISAMYENGGNTTHRMFDGHPELFVYPFESQLGTGYAQDYLGSVVPIRYRWPEFPTEGSPERDYEMFWDEELKTLLRVPGRSKFSGCGLEMEETARKEIFVAFLEGRERTRQNLVAAYFESAFRAWKNYSTSGRESAYLGYNPVQVLDAEKFFADFPGGHMIHVVRNPYSGYSDTKKRPFPLSLERYVWTWNLCQQMALTHVERNAGRFHLLRFEDLAADPEEALRPILGAIGLEWAPECAYPSFNSERLVEVFPWGTIKTPTTESNLETLAELSTEEMKEIASLAGVLLPRLKYDDLLSRAHATG